MNTAYLITDGDSFRIVTGTPGDPSQTGSLTPPMPSVEALRDALKAGLEACGEEARAAGGVRVSARGACGAALAGSAGGRRMSRPSDALLVSARHLVRERELAAEVQALRRENARLRMELDDRQAIIVACMRED